MAAVAPITAVVGLARGELEPLFLGSRVEKTPVAGGGRVRDHRAPPAPPFPRYDTKGLILAAAVIAAGALASAAQASVPGDIAPPAGNQAFLHAHAVGVQIYSCNANGWALVAPRADLYKHGKLVATHFAGPTWQAKDGSKVVGARVNGVKVDPTAIDWLLLSATSTTPGRF